MHVVIIVTLFYLQWISWTCMYMQLLYENDQKWHANKYALVCNFSTTAWHVLYSIAAAIYICCPIIFIIYDGSSHDHECMHAVKIIMTQPLTQRWLSLYIPISSSATSDPWAWAMFPLPIVGYSYWIWPVSICCDPLSSKTKYPNN